MTETPAVTAETWRRRKRPKLPRSLNDRRS